MTARRRALGASGEARTAAAYEAAGYRVVDRNWRCRDGEIDLVVRRGSTLVFCEVKARSSTAFGLPAEAVGRQKQARLRRLALAWLAAHDGAGGADIRFDVASVVGDDVAIIESAF